MKIAKHFDYHAAAREAGVSPSQLDRLCEEIRQEFPNDDMQFELHVLRACMAIKDGKITIQAALAGPAAKSR